jgi:hypothetical protein
VGASFQRSLLPGRVIPLELTAQGIVPAVLDVAPGEKVTFELRTSETTSLHVVDVSELAMMRLDAGGMMVDHGRTSIGTIVPAGVTVRMTWTAPDEVGGLARLRLHDAARDTIAELTP